MEGGGRVNWTFSPSMVSGVATYRSCPFGTQGDLEMKLKLELELELEPNFIPVVLIVAL